MCQKDPMRRILNSFGTDSSIEGIEIDLSPSDVSLLFGASTVGFVVVILAGLPDFWPFQAIGILIALLLPLSAGVLIYVTPAWEASTICWLSQIYKFRRQQKYRSIVAVDPENRTEPLTEVGRFYPNLNAVERTDGVLVGGVRVNPANLSLASQEEWERVADEFGDALNSLGFDLFIYSSTHNIHDEEILGAYDGRETDPDVANNASLRDLVEMYQTHLRAELASGTRDTSLRDYYILVSVDNHSVQLETYGAFENLTSIPVIGCIVRTLVGAASGTSNKITLVMQAQRLALRIEDVEDAIKGVSNCSTEVLETSELAGLIEEYWSGNRSEFAKGHKQLRSSPVVVSETNERVGQ